MRVTPSAELAALLGPAPLDIHPDSALAATLRESGFQAPSKPIQRIQRVERGPAPTPGPFYLPPVFIAAIAFALFVFATVAALTFPMPELKPASDGSKLQHRMQTHYAYTVPLK